MKSYHFALIVGLLGLSSVVTAQERAVTGPLDTQTSWTALQGIANNALNRATLAQTDATTALTKTKSIENCGKQGKVWNGANCATAGSSLSIPKCGSGKVLTSTNGTTFTCTTPVDSSTNTCKIYVTTTDSGSCSSGYIRIPGTAEHVTRSSDDKFNRYTCMKITC